MGFDRQANPANSVCAWSYTKGAVQATQTCATCTNGNTTLIIADYLLSIAFGTWLLIVFPNNTNCGVLDDAALLIHLMREWMTMEDQRKNNF